MTYNKQIIEFCCIFVDIERGKPMKHLIAILICCCFLAACTSNTGNTAATDAATTDTVAADSVINPFPLLKYPESWYFHSQSVEIPPNVPVIPYPFIDMHYKTFETVSREYGGPAFYREIEYRNGKCTTEVGYGNTEHLDSILKDVPRAEVMLFHWGETTNRDSTQRGYDMDLYFLDDGDSLRVFYGIKFLPGTDVNGSL